MVVGRDVKTTFLPSFLPPLPQGHGAAAAAGLAGAADAGHRGHGHAARISFINEQLRKVFINLGGWGEVPPPLRFFEGGLGGAWGGAQAGGAQAGGAQAEADCVAAACLRAPCRGGGGP
jgi:hypothetical protein